MRDRLIELLDEAKDKALETIGSLNSSFAAWYADYLLAAGVVEVVRCKDCKHYGRQYGDRDIGYCCHTKQHGYCDRDHFCAYGQRRENNER